jgi:hypothetical protein
MKTYELLAEAGYLAYCKQAGVVTFDRKPIPVWAHIGAERQACWVACAKEVVAQSAAPVMMRPGDSIDNYSIRAHTSPDSFTTIYSWAPPDTPLPFEGVVVAEAPSRVIYSSGGGGDFGGGGYSGSYDSSSDSSDSSSSSSDSSLGSSD